MEKEEEEKKRKENCCAFASFCLFVSLSVSLSSTYHAPLLVATFSGPQNPPCSHSHSFSSPYPSSLKYKGSGEERGEKR